VLHSSFWPLGDATSPAPWRMSGDRAIYEVSDKLVLSYTPEVMFELELQASASFKFGDASGRKERRRHRSLGLHVVAERRASRRIGADPRRKSRG
jgi:hypothetical protein